MRWRCDVEERSTPDPGGVEPDGPRSCWLPPGNPNVTHLGVAVPVTSARDSVEHLVREEAMTPGSAGSYVAVCGRPVRAAALACPPGPRCPACTAARNTDTRSERQRDRQDRSGGWAWLNVIRRGRHRGAGATGGAPDAH